jgi:glycosyltransferase involved in cell wall biosynthesis
MARADARGVGAPLEERFMKLALIGRDAARVLAFRGSLVRAAQALGHEVIAVTGEGTAADRATLEAARVRLHEVRLDGGGMNPLRDRRYRAAVETVLRAERPDAALAYNPKCVAHGVPAARAAGVRTVVAMVTGLGHGFTEGGVRSWFVRTAKCRLFRSAFAMSDTVLLHNADDLETLRRHGAIDAAVDPRVRVIAGSGVDLCAFPAQPVPPGAHFLMVARPLREKGLDTFLQASAKVLRELPGATCTWLGPLQDANPTAIARAEVERLLRESGVRHVPEQADLRPWLRACSVFVLPSLREGTSKVMLEAMATGRAVVTTDAPGCGSAVGAQAFGAVVPVRDASALATAMIQVGRDHPRLAALGAAARASAVASFDATRVDSIVLRSLCLER